MNQCVDMEEAHMVPSMCTVGFHWKKLESEEKSYLIDSKTHFPMP